MMSDISEVSVALSLIREALTMIEGSNALSLVQHLKLATMEAERQQRFNLGPDHRSLGEDCREES